MFFSLKLQRDNRKNALAVEPAKGKTRKKLYFSSHCGDETTTITEPNFNVAKNFKVDLLQLWIPPMGRLGKAVFSPYCGDEATICMTGPFHSALPLVPCLRFAEGGFPILFSPLVIFDIVRGGIA